MQNPLMSNAQHVIPVERIVSRIYLIRGEKVMLDADLADLYGVETGALVRAMKRNADRFPEDFAFQLTKNEFENLRCQIGISSQWGGRRTPPWAFIEHGVAMLSSVLRSKKATQVNIRIIRAFVTVRQMLATNRELARKVQEHDQTITVLVDAVQKLLTLPPPKKNPIGFVPSED